MPPKPNVRRLLSQTRSSRQQTQRVNHPLARYDSFGKLSCVACGPAVAVKSDAVWNAHLASSGHKEIIAKLKAIKEKGLGQGGQAQVTKRVARDEDEGMEVETIVQREKRKMAESMQALKVSSGLVGYGADEENDEENEEGEQDAGEASENVSKPAAPPSKRVKHDEDDTATAPSGLPADFFDVGVASSVASPPSSNLPVDFFDNPPTAATPPAPTAAAPPALSAPTSALPEGFFDDRELDAKARNAPLPTVDEVLAREYELFQRQIAAESVVSAQIQEEDETELWQGRDEELEWQQGLLVGRVERLKLRRAAKGTVDEMQRKEEEDDNMKAREEEQERTVFGGVPSSKGLVRDLLRKAKKAKEEEAAAMEEDDDEEDLNLDELDWRAQNLY
ncbi:hypothetical protein BC937DRAFT_91344 [Endogone sp. FLAS-F59071]|nr:hypothetical protein BC937DRAFT_91344 [Endogone sp. FLAS-F59071]|eukprot:RUS21838.1 hypothetical protein BC937DRAFT_91344 [Endogone sp. FLAS-F59071]